MGQRRAEEPDTPVCSLNAFQIRYLRDWQSLHAPFLKELGLSEMQPQGLSRSPTSRQLYSEVNAGKRRLDWCPGGLRIFEHLYPFFLSRGLDIAVPSIVYPRLSALVGEEAWIVTSDRVYSDENEHRQHVSQSGFLDKLILPTVPQLAFLVAATLYRFRQVPFAVAKDCQPRYARTSTRLSDDLAVGVAFVPTSGLIFASYPMNAESSGIVTTDAFVLT